jgi:hypothetical protein
MPNIMPMEVVAVSAAFLVLCVMPAVLGWVGTMRRRRAAREAHAERAATAMMVAAGPLADITAHEPEPTVASAETVLTPHPAASAQLPDATTASPLAALLPREPDQEPPAVVAVAPTAAEEADEALALAAPVSSPEALHEFRLRELRRARILDWPPAAVRADAERNRLWQEGVRLASEHQARIETATLAASFVPQSACFGAAEADGQKLRLRFLLFRDLWPVNEAQAVGDAVFEIDGSTSAMRSWLEPHRLSAA